MTVSGIVVNFRTPELTLRAAESLLADGVDEVIVVENGSGDDSADRLTAWADHDPRVHLVVSDQNLGFGQGVNLGARSAEGTLLFLLNSDAVAITGALDALRGSLASERSVVAVAPSVVDDQGNEQLDAHGVFPSLRALILRTNRHPPDVEDPDWISGVAALVRRSAFDAVGGFDDRFFMYYEDVDLCRRLRAQGGTVRRNCTARVVHGHRQSRVSDREFFRQYFHAQDTYVAAAEWPFWRRAALHLARQPIKFWRFVREGLPGSSESAVPRITRDG